LFSKTRLDLKITDRIILDAQFEDNHPDKKFQNYSEKSLNEMACEVARKMGVKETDLV